MGKKKRTAVLDPTELKAVAKTLDKGEGADVKGIKGELYCSIFHVTMG